jgi:hypothetical protein
MCIFQHFDSFLHSTGMTVFEFSSLVIAIPLAAITIYQIFTTRKHNRLSCSPRLVSEINRDHSDDEYLITYTVFNRGLGPAEIMSIQLFIDGDEYTEKEHPCRKLCKTVFSEYAGFKVNYDAWCNSGYLIADKESYKFVQLKFNGGQETPLAEIEKDLSRFKIKIEYASLYGEKYSFDSSEN